MHINLKYLLFSLALVINGRSLSGFSSFQLLLSPQGKLVLLMGDAMTGVTEEVAQDIDECKNFMGHFQKSYLTRPFEVLLDIVAFEGDGSQTLNPTFSALKEYRSDKRFRFTCCDEIREISDGLETLRTIISDIADETIPLAERIKFCSLDTTTIVPVEKSSKTTLSWETVRKNFLTRKRGELQDHPDMQKILGFLGTVNNYFASLDTNLKEMEAIVKKYESDQLLHATLMNSCIHPFKKALEEIKTTFARTPGNDRMGRTLLNFLFGPETTIEFMERFEWWQINFLDHTDTLFTSTKLFDALYSRTNTADPICLIACESSVQAIGHTLRTLPAWTSLSNVTRYTLRKSLLTFKVAIPQFVDALNLSQNIFITSLLQTCTVCKGTKNLRECSRCQQSYYCSIECVKKGYSEHKKLCTAL